MKRWRSKLSPSLTAKIRRQAQFRCGYCLSSEILLGASMEIEHLIPLAIGGTNSEENLWLACRRCNGFKGVQTEAVDPATKQLTTLFNPRAQYWQEHFQWNEDGSLIVGLTPCGRATVTTLKLNASEICATRRLWASVGWWPPSE